jgi:CheY-like chemotaxis protein
MKNVLLVEDDSIFKLLKTKTIQQTGIPVPIHTTLNGRVASSLAKEYFQFSPSLPEIILHDINMPGMMGLVLFKLFSIFFLRDKRCKDYDDNQFS